MASASRKKVSPRSVTPDTTWLMPRGGVARNMFKTCALGRGKANSEADEPNPQSSRRNAVVPPPYGPKLAPKLNQHAYAAPANAPTDAEAQSSRHVAGSCRPRADSTVTTPT